MRRLIDLTGLGRHPRTIARLGTGRSAVVVGTIYGDVSRLVDLHQKILQRSPSLPAQHRLAIYMGGFIGGAHSAEVIDLLLSAPLDGFFKICLAGEPERQFMSLLMWHKSDFSPDCISLDWLNTKEADATLNSYAIHRGKQVDLNEAKRLYHTLTSVIPQDHIEFLLSLRDAYSLGNFVFCSNKVAVYNKEKILITLDGEGNPTCFLQGHVFNFNEYKQEQVVLFLQDKS